MLENKLVNKVVIQDGKVTSMEFDYPLEYDIVWGYETDEDCQFIAGITQSQITLRTSESMQVYNRKNKILSSYPNHCCGAHGFGYDPNDRCPACKGDVYTEKIDGNLKGSFGNIFVEIETYCERLESLLKFEF
jgi:hypothetical protein